MPLTRTRRVTLVAAALIALTVFSGCSAQGAADNPRKLTSDEASQLALVRFRNYDAGVREASFEVTDQGVNFQVDAWVDFPASLGYGTVSSEDETQSMAWTASGIASTTVTDNGSAPLPPPTEGWSSSTLVPEQSRLHTVLAILLTLGSDRPDTPLLLAQTDARWLREDTIGDTPVTVYRGPSSDTVEGAGSEDTADGQDAATPDASGGEVRYWVNENSSLLRLELVLGSSSETVTVDMQDAPDDVDFADAILQLGG